MASFHNNNMNPPSGEGENIHLQAMYARLQAARNAQTQHSQHSQHSEDSASASAPSGAHDLLSRFHSYNQATNPRDYYGQGSGESPVTGLDDYPPPAAPTPPTGFGHSHHPPGVIGSFPAAGAMSSNPASSADQSVNLLNLLKFSGAQAQNSQVHPHSQTHSQTHSQSQASPAGSVHSMPFGSSPSQSHAIHPPPIHAPVPMPADPQGLLATLMKGNAHNESSAPRVEHQPSNLRESWNIGPPTTTQEYLLNLLHRPKPAQNDQPSTNESSQPATLTPQSANDSQTDHYKEYMPRQSLLDNISHDSTPLPHQFSSSPHARHDFQSPPPHHGHHDASLLADRFNYTNPFEGFHSSRGKTSKSSTPGAPGPVTTLPTELPAAIAFHNAEGKGSASATSSPGNTSEHKRFSYNGPLANTEPAHPQFDRYLSDAGRSRGSPYTTGSYEHESDHDHENDRERESERDLELGDDHGRKNANDNEQNRETVHEALTDLAEKADLEAQEALARAEREEAQAQIAADLEEMIEARTDAEFQESAEAAARDISEELNKEHNAGVLEASYSPEAAQVIRDIVEDAAHGAVADSWESAEADEIVVIEELPTPVKVYNFPMKPWISITMQNSFDEPRPQFRDEIILDIARLKKEFDQIDRNLVAATESYIAYGMSKAGGLRVIRQEDGKDAKLFTDTKDRVFNVAVSYTSDDGDIPPEESIIGTGISGTVYYVQIKGGGKDHLDESAPEQYGFALPPASMQEGDAPGGILKTRARTSATHPEYFAVGRGKTISIVWPAVVIQKNIFKPGHDRLVDTEKLAKECALRINTGKAGKDFTFSQDDTTIVSLDKSGRVKFWDVRDLTAVDMNSDVRFPMPAHTSLEIKEPLMTLNTTPEGEKAWPTSVLLLDKQRPYQKRCALRYMIVGMKQNHTLQLWDLALGKPVQEFNLPHSKESDAVCSVMYHPATGMIVVGHPTRNSIYFLHLSAPKYTIKGLSQVDYIQKLVAKDSSIPEPDSTAVISGVREYSLVNKGLLRSLDILEAPSSSSSSEEPSLFDLYAMHSKGVTAISIKQADLGWSKDNKVILGVDATESGLVKISKLKELPNAIVPEQHVMEEQPVAPIKIATRPSVKENAASHTVSPASGHEAHRRNGESAVSHFQNERKESEIPVTPANQLDKSEKKSRKKREKEKAAAAAAEKVAAESSQPNASSNTPRTETVHATKNGELKTAVSPSPQSSMSAESVQSAVRQISSGLGEKLTAVITHELKDHRNKVESEFRHRSDSYAKSQKELLELVSSVLNDNIQAVLSRTITDQFEDSVVPHLSNLITKTIESQIDSKLGGKVSHSVNNQLQKTLPHAVTNALQKADLTKSISERLASSVALDMEESFRETLVSTITPIFSDMAVASSRSLMQDVQRRTAEQFQEFEQRHIMDTQKIDKLTALVSKLSDTISEIAATQNQMQDRLAQMQSRLSQDRVQTRPQPTQPTAYQTASYGSPSATSSHRGSHSHQLVSYPSASHPSSKDTELQHLITSVASFMERGEYETGLIRWIQLPRQHDIFDEYIVKFDPQIVRDMPALVSLSVASVLAEQLDGPHLRERVNWVEFVLNSLYSSLPHVTDPAVREVVPKIMSTFLERVEKLFMRISARAPSDSILQHLSSMTTLATRIRDYARNTAY